MPVPPVSPLDAAGAMLQAARMAMASRGYAHTTVRSVAAAASVAPGVVSSLYRNRERLLAAALRLPLDPAQAVPELIAPGLDGMGERLVRMMLTLMSDTYVRADLARLLSSDVSVLMARRVIPGEPASIGLSQLRAVTEFLSSSVVDRAVAAVGVPDARMRGTLITSYLLGVAMSRYVLALEPLASASDDEVVRLMAPALQDLLDPTRTPGAT